MLPCRDCLPKYRHCVRLFGAGRVEIVSTMCRGNSTVGFANFGSTLLVLGCLSTTLALAHPVDISSACKTMEHDIECRYSVNYSLQENVSKITIGLRIPRALVSSSTWRYSVIPSSESVTNVCQQISKENDDFIEYTLDSCADPNTAKVSLVVVADRSKYTISSSDSYVRLEMAQEVIESQSTVQLPTQQRLSNSSASPSESKKTPSASQKTQPLSSFVRPVISVGLSTAMDDHIDFRSIRDTDDFIVIGNDSRTRTELSTGALFRLKEFGKGSSSNWRKTIDLVFQFQFAEGGQSALDGLFFGGGIGVTRHLELIAGYSRGLGKELSFGFEKAMGAYIKENQAEYPSVHLDSDGVISDKRHYDGLPLKRLQPDDDENMTKVRIYPGEPLVDSYNSKFTIGFAFTFDIWKAATKTLSNGRAEAR